MRELELRTLLAADLFMLSLLILNLSRANLREDAEEVGFSMTTCEELQLVLSGSKRSHACKW